MSMKKLTDITFTSTGGSVYAVYRDDVLVSSHNALHKAIEAAANLMIKYPESDVEIRQELKIRGNGKFKDVQEPDPVYPEPEEPEEPRIPDPDPDPDNELEYAESSVPFTFTTN